MKVKLYYTEKDGREHIIAIEADDYNAFRIALEAAVELIKTKNLKNTETHIHYHYSYTFPNFWDKPGIPFWRESLWNPDYLDQITSISCDGSDSTYTFSSTSDEPTHIDGINFDGPMSIF